MKSLILVMGILLSVSSSFAQSVIKVDKGQAVVSTREIKLKSGDEITFFDGNLSEAARGLVTKITPNGGQALVKVTKGQVQAGMSFEKSEASPEMEKAETQKTDSGRVKYSDLTPEERELLQRGELSTARYVFGGILATYPFGLGIGHAVQGRYAERGWVFTVGELGSIAVFMAGIGNCVDRSYYTSSSNCSTGLVLLSAFSYLGFRVWEAIDAWAIPPQQNRRYRELRHRMGENTVTFSPLILPRPDGGAIGLQVSF